MNRPPFIVGVSGHQHLGDESVQRFVAQQFQALLVAYQQREPHLVLYSALARGADQLFVRIAVEQGVPVEVVLPCAEYETLFPSGAERNAYQHMLQASQAVHQLAFQACTNEAFLAAGQWIVDHSDVLVLAWNGLPPLGRGGTADVASYARFVGRPFAHLDTKHQRMKMYQPLPDHEQKTHPTSPKRAFITAKEQVYAGPTLMVNQYQLQMPDGETIIRDVVERPESVLIVPAGEQDIVLLIEEYDLGAGAWQLTLPGGKIETVFQEKLEEQAQQELRQEIGYKAGRLEKLLEFYSHPGYISHHVHAFIAHNLEWDPLAPEKHEEIRMRTFTLQEALEATLINNRCDPEAAFLLWMYARKKGYLPTKP